MLPGKRLMKPAMRKDARALRECCWGSPSLLRGVKRAGLNKAIQLFPQPTQDTKTGLADGVGSHAKLRRNPLTWFVLQTGPGKSGPGLLAEIVADEVQGSPDDPLPGGFEWRLLISRVEPLLHLAIVCRNGIALLLAEMKPYLIDRDAPQPGMEHATLTAKLVQVSEYGTEDLLNGIGGIAIL